MAHKREDGQHASGHDESAAGETREVENPSSRRPSRFPVVALGGSAGALAALQEFFGAAPPDSGCAFVVITHQHPDHKSLLPEILAKATSMPVAEALDGMPVEPDHVYVAVPDGRIAIDDGMLVVGHEPGAPDPGTAEHGQSTRASHHPIDAFFRAVAAERQELAIGVVLSGSSTDGSIGLKDIKAESGMVLVQKPETAEFDDMPLSALRTSLVDHALAPDKLPQQIVEYARGVARRTDEEGEEEPERVPEEKKDEILALLRARCGHDFSGYKRKTILRRIQRRMDIRHIEHGSEYADYLRQNPEEIDTLFREAIVSVTRFFRDPGAWQALETALLDRIGSLPDGGELRVWVVGCATGEEAYTAAIVASECMEHTGRHLPVQVFATDLEPNAIETARVGEYPAGVQNDLPAELLEKYFLRVDDHFRAQKTLRERVVFAVQNVTQDPPFTRMDIISCRNLLIYLETGLQRKLLPMLHYALKPGGLLLLGASETISPERFGDYFEPLDRGWKLFRRGEQKMPHQPLPQLPVRPVPRGHADEQDRGDRPVTFGRTVERLLLDRYAPASAAVNDDGQAAYFHGRTGKYLEPAAGVPGNNILEMAREGLRPALFDALRTARIEEQAAIVQRHARVLTNGGYEPVLIQASRMDAPESVRGLLLVSFQPVPETTTGAAERNDETAGSDDERVARLEREFEAVTAEKRWTLEQLEATNQDLQSANEELQSTNEELQSTNEELETSKEEMEALNEELSAVNAELQEKIGRLEQANNDMNNMLNSTELAILFLSKDLRVRRFTEKVCELISLRESDIGRPVGELASNLRYENLVEDAEAVLRTVRTREIDFQTKNGGWCRMRMMPYWTLDQRVDGLVCTFIGIDETKRAEHREAYFRSIVQTVREPLVVLDAGLWVVSANTPFYTAFGLQPEQVEGSHIFSLAGGQWDHPELRRLLEELLPRSRSLVDYELRAYFERAGRKRMLLNARQLEREPSEPELILLALEIMD